MYGYQHNRHNKNLLMVHLIFVIKYRRKIIEHELRESIKQYNPTDSITSLVSMLKQESTYLAWKNSSHLLRKYYWKEKTLWSEGYFAASVGQVSQSTIEHYIESQG